MGVIILQSWYTQYPFTFIIDYLRYDVPLSLCFDPEPLGGSPREFFSIETKNPNPSEPDRNPSLTDRYGIAVDNNEEDVYYLCYYKRTSTGALTRFEFRVIAASEADFDCYAYSGTQWDYNPDTTWDTPTKIHTSTFSYDDKTVYYAAYNVTPLTVTTTFINEETAGVGTQIFDNSNYIIADYGTRYYAWLMIFGENMYINDPYERPPQDDPPRGGNGDWNNDSDIVVVDPLPAGLWGQGFISVYVPTVAQLRAFATDIWKEDNVRRYNDIFPQGLTSGIVDCFTIPVLPDTAGVGYISMGGQVLTTTQSAILANRFKLVDFGSITLREYFGAFPDYMSTKIAIYLPYIGWEEIAPEMCINSVLNLQYKIDCLTGDFVAILTTNRVDKFNFQGISYTFNGNCAARIPLTARTGAGTYDYVSAAISGLTTIAGGLMTGNPVAVAGGTLSTANSMLSMNDKHTFALKGGFSGSKGQLSPQCAYLVINRPVMENGAKNNYFNEMGSPSTDFTTVASCATNGTGIVKAMECKIENSNFDKATEQEKTEIYNMLKAGVII